MKRLCSYINSQCSQIEGSFALRWYGAGLSLALGLCTYYWLFSRGLHVLLNGKAACWPFFENCHEYRNLSPGFLESVLWGLLVASVVNACLFIRKSTVRFGYIGLGVLFLVSVTLYLQDFRLRLNQNYMLYFIVTAFLFADSKRFTIKLLLIGFYFWAGIIKLNMEWLSGSGIYKLDELWIPEALHRASFAYVVILETILVFGLLSKRTWIFYCTLAQLYLFHLFSFPIVNYYYPTLMFILISIFWIERLTEEESDDRPSFTHRLSSLRTIPIIFVIFVVGQLIPKLIPGESNITGEGRFFSLHMFDSRVECKSHVIYHFDNGESVAGFSFPMLGRSRIRCDPIIYLSMANDRCRDLEFATGPQTPVDFDFILQSKDSQSTEYQFVVDIKDYCAQGITYTVFWPNDWILK